MSAGGFVVVLVIELHFPDAGSLKSKRKELSSIKAQLHGRLGVTVAATHARDTERIREALPSALFLVLGYGAQGASAREAVRGFRRGPAGLEGGMVSSSRPILFPASSSDRGGSAWEQGVRGALARAMDELGEAVA